MSTALDVYQKLHSSSSFSVGDEVIVMRKVAGPVPRNDGSILDLWVSGMDRTIGNVHVVRSSTRDGVELSNGFCYPSCALRLKEKAMQTKPVSELHDINAFKIGDEVIIGSKSSPNNWGQVWDDEGMNPLLDYLGKVVSTSDRNGFLVQTERDGIDASFWYPSTSLRPATPAPAAAKAKSKRRVRVGPGPWDQAPCSHLRWTLMGFFRDKLVLVKTLVRTTDTSGNSVEVELGQMDVACKKCNTRMTLRAK
jgi:hypothetical protein